MNKLTKEDLSLLKYYKEGNELCGFERDISWDNLCKLDYLDGDLELTKKAKEFIKEYKDWDSIISYKNNTYIRIK